MRERFLQKVGLVSLSDLDRFDSFEKSKQIKIVQLLENGFTFKEVKTYTIWNK